MREDTGRVRVTGLAGSVLPALRIMLERPARPAGVRSFGSTNSRPDGTLRRVIQRTHEPVRVTDDVLSEHEHSYRTAMENAPNPGSHGLERSAGRSR